MGVPITSAGCSIFCEKMGPLTLRPKQLIGVDRMVLGAFGVYCTVGLRERETRGV